jgi:transposase
MMTKIVLYAYTQKWYSCRQIARSLRENLPMMWLAARQEPDFRTINRFRSERMQDIITPLFTRLVELLLDEQYISMDTYFLDGTKIEANANRYTFVWRKSVEKHEARLLPFQKQGGSRSKGREKQLKVSFSSLHLLFTPM